MKKIFALLLLFVLSFSALVSCGEDGPAVDNGNGTVDPNAKSEGVMTYAEYMAAELDSAVVIEGFVQATQGWWNNEITVYLQDGDGAYFLYEMTCSETDAAKLTQGTKIKVTGYKAEWEGEIEVIDATFEFVDTTDKWVASATDVTDLLGNETEIIKHQNKLIKLTDMTVKAVEYKNGEPGDDIYVTFTKGGVDYKLTVEYYLTNDTTEVYAVAGALEEGDIVDIEGFLYWYNGFDTHITSITKK